MMANITKDTTLGELVNKHPEAVPILLNYGLHCIGCHVSFFETIEQGAKAHGMDDGQIKKMLDEVNTSIEKSRK